jgi:16S rRNA (guanine966-N2)-methyltransferase
MNTVRIIGGEWRRRVLRFPDSEALRPTPDRVRETLFNWLGQDLSGRSCLDLFAGSGALGFEAASRGADRVVLVEQAPKVLAALETNARLLNVGERLQIMRMDAVKCASSLCSGGARFDVIFLDPPYKQGWLERLTPVVSRLAADDGVIYVEAEQALETMGEWRTMRHGRAGQVFYHLMRKGEPDGTE